MVCALSACTKPERCEKYMHISKKGSLVKSESVMFDHLIDSNEKETYLWFNHNRLINEPTEEYLDHFHSCECPI